MPLQHDNPIGGRCRRCGLAYSVKTSYVPCLEPGETLAEWRARQNDAVLELTGRPRTDNERVSAIEDDTARRTSLIEVK